MSNKTNTVFITGLWDIGRNDLTNINGGDWKRSFKFYTDKLEELLSTSLNFIVYGDNDLEEIVKKYKNAKFVYYPKDNFYNIFPYFDKINTIRQSEFWFNQPNAEWLKNSPQAKLELYTPIQLSKFFLIEKTKKTNPEYIYIYWLDAGITRTHKLELFQTLTSRLEKYDKFVFLSHYYTENSEIHGFERVGVHKYCNKTFVERIMKGFFFGGNVQEFDTIMDLYHNVLQETLNENYLGGADETYHTILVNQRPDLFNQIIIPHCIDTFLSI